MQMIIVINWVWGLSSWFYGDETVFVSDFVHIFTHLLIRYACTVKLESYSPEKHNFFE